ncbi:hypothetical protein Musp01_08720 [Muricauda sp. NBRC 101325]|nr:hypothetical protein Musp01_08720 [Muricauda sp. NBRC 101325]
MGDVYKNQENVTYPLPTADCNYQPIVNLFKKSYGNEILKYQGNKAIRIIALCWIHFQSKINQRILNNYRP